MKYHFPWGFTCRGWWPGGAAVETAWGNVWAVRKCAMWCRLPERDDLFVYDEEG